AREGKHANGRPWTGRAIAPIIERETGWWQGQSMHLWRLGSMVGAASLGLILSLAGSASAQVIAPRVETVPIPPNLDRFNLSFEEFKAYSSMQNFELIGH